jgi:hypothetical protein
MPRRLILKRAPIGDNQEDYSVGTRRIADVDDLGCAASGFR